MEIGDLIKCSHSGALWVGIVLDIKFDTIDIKAPHSILVWRANVPKDFQLSWWPINKNIEVINALD